KREGFLSGRTSMRTNSLRLLLGCVAVVACVSLPALRADDDEQKAIASAREIILKMADGTNPDDPTKFLNPQRLAEGFETKHELYHAETVAFRLKTKGGLGIGRLTGAGHRDGIEMLIRDYALRPPTNDEVVKYNDDLVRIGRVSLAMTEVLPHFAPKK